MTVTGTYVGDKVSHLRGKTALIRPEVMKAGKLEMCTGRVLAQFDDVETGLGYGWHAFAADEFEIHEQQQEAAK